MTLKAQISEDMKTAMKAGDKERLKVVRLILAAVKQIEIDQRIDLDDAGVLSVLDKMVKQRRDSVSQFQDGGRQDLVDIELQEISVLDTYLPEQLNDAELDEIIDEAIADSGAESIRDIGIQYRNFLKAQISEDMKTAMKAGDKERLKVVRLILAAVKQIEIDQRIDLDDAGVLSVLDKMVKQRRDSVSQFQDGGRQDLVDIELQEISVLDTYLPEQLNVDQILTAAILELADRVASSRVLREADPGT